MMAVYKLVLGVSQEEESARRWPFHIPTKSAGHSAANPSEPGRYCSPRHRARQILLATSQDVAKLLETNVQNVLEADVAGVGPGRYCAPCHWLAFDS